MNITEVQAAHSAVRLAPVLERARRDLLNARVLMENGHFDNKGEHSSSQVNPHLIFFEASLAWRLAQDLLEVLEVQAPAIFQSIEIVAGPATGGAIMASYIANMLSSRREINRPVYFVPIKHDPRREFGYHIEKTYLDHLFGKNVFFVDDIRDRSQTAEICTSLVEQEGGGKVIADGFFVDRGRMPAMSRPTFKLVTLPKLDYYPAKDCPKCKAGIPITKY
jgi:adenine/guanine phosphoribosyltransferase-like PRPP-binding protein